MHAQFLDFLITQLSLGQAFQVTRIGTRERCHPGASLGGDNGLSEYIAADARSCTEKAGAAQIAFKSRSFRVRRR